MPTITTREAVQQETNVKLARHLTPGQAGVRRLVPSRYALRVGEIDVLVISDGVFPLPAATLATNADPADLAAWLDDRLEPPDVYTWPLNVVVVRSGGRTVLIDSGQGRSSRISRGWAVGHANGRRRHRSRIRDRRGAYPPARGPRWRLLADGLRGRLRPDVPIHLAAAEAEFWASPDFSRNTFGGFPDVLRSAEKRFVDVYRSQLRPFEKQYEVAPGVVVFRTGGHTLRHGVVRLASGGDRLTFVGDAVFPNHFDHPDWHNAFDHDPEEAVRVRVRLLHELAATREPLVAAHLPFPSVGRVAVAGDVFFVGSRPSGRTDRLLGRPPAPSPWRSPGWPEFACCTASMLSGRIVAWAPSSRSGRAR